MQTNQNVVSGKITKIVYVILLVMYTVAYNNQLRGNSILWYGISVLTIAVLAFVLLQKGKFHITTYTIWMFVFYAFCFMSITWSLEKEFVNPLKTLLLIYIVCILLSCIIDNRMDFQRLMQINYIALLLCAVYILLMVDKSMLGEERIGSDTMWNSNDIALTMCFGLALALYYIRSSKKRSAKLFNIGAFLLFLILILYSGSRKGFLFALLIIVLTLLLSSKGIKKTQAVIFISILLVIAYIAVMNYEPLYNVLGSRLEDLINGVFGEGTDDNSFNWRSLMISSGWDWFKERPIFGYGLDNYRLLLYENYGWETYSHNNYIEILVSGGIIGFAIYYFISAYVLVKLYKPAVKEKDPAAICLLTLVVSRLFIEVGAVTYYSTITYSLLLWATLYIDVLKREGKEELSKSAVDTSPSNDNKKFLHS